MSLRVVRTDAPTLFGFLGEHYAVFDEHDRQVGTVTRVAGALLAPWSISDAGPGVPFDRSLRFTSREQAAEECQRRWTAAQETDETGLTAFQRDVLDLETRLVTAQPGDREREARETLGLTATRYFQALNAIIDLPAALAYEPVTVNRLRRIREVRRARRHAQYPRSA